MFKDFLKSIFQPILTAKTILTGIYSIQCINQKFKKPLPEP